MRMAGQIFMRVDEVTFELGVPRPYADEVAQKLGISKSHAYKVIHGLNEELQEKGYLTISGRVNREFFREKYYYTKTAKEES